MKYLTFSVTTVLAALFSHAASADGETIAVFTKNLTNPYFQAVRVGTETAAKSLGVKVIQYVPTKPDSIPEQLSQVEDVIVKKPDAIVFVPVDYKALVPAVEKINAAGIPVTNIIDRSAGGKFVAFVGADDYSIGLATARGLLKAIGGKGNVVILEGVKGSLTNTDRVRGFNDALKESPGVKLLGSQPANYQRLQALQVMENLMQSFPAIDGVLAANDPMAVGAIEALEGANRKALVGVRATAAAGQWGNSSQPGAGGGGGGGLRVGSPGNQRPPPTPPKRRPPKGGGVEGGGFHKTPPPRRGGPGPAPAPPRHKNTPPKTKVVGGGAPRGGGGGGGGGPPRGAFYHEVKEITCNDLHFRLCEGFRMPADDGRRR